MPGKPLVYATSKNFMDYFGINSPEDLPKIKEVLAEQIVEGTVIRPEDFTDQPVADTIEEAITEEPVIEGDTSLLTVNEDGELIIQGEEVEENNESSDSDDDTPTDEENPSDENQQ